MYTFSECDLVPRAWSYETCCLSSAEGGIPDALLDLEWLIAPALSTPMPGMPDVFESHPEALNSPCVLYSELKSLTLYSITLKTTNVLRVCVCQVFLKLCLPFTVLQLVAMLNHHIGNCSSNFNITIDFCGSGCNEQNEKLLTKSFFLLCSLIVIWRNLFRVVITTLWAQQRGSCMPLLRF